MKRDDAYPKNIKNIDNNHLIQILNILTIEKHVLNAANPKFAKYSNGPIEGINYKFTSLGRHNFGMPKLVLRSVLVKKFQVQEEIHI